MIISNVTKIRRIDLLVLVWDLESKWSLLTSYKLYNRTKLFVQCSMFTFLFPSFNIRRSKRGRAHCSYLILNTYYIHTLLLCNMIFIDHWHSPWLASSLLYYCTHITHHDIIHIIFAICYWLLTTYSQCSIQGSDDGPIGNIKLYYLFTLHQRSRY